MRKNKSEINLDDSANKSFLTDLNNPHLHLYIMKHVSKTNHLLNQGSMPVFINYSRLFMTNLYNVKYFFFGIFMQTM